MLKSKCVLCATDGLILLTAFFPDRGLSILARNFSQAQHNNKKLQASGVFHPLLFHDLQKRND